MFFQDRVIDLLDRKFDFVMNSPSYDFILELEAFIDYILSDGLLKSHCDQLYSIFERRWHQYDADLEQEREASLQLRHVLVELFPDLDDSQLEYNSDSHGFPSNEYLWSLAAFDDIINRVERNKPELYFQDGNIYNDTSDVAVLIRLLWRKLDCLQPSPDRDRFLLDLQQLDDQHKQTHRDFVNHARVSPGSSLSLLTEIVDMINPVARRYEDPTEFTRDLLRETLSTMGQVRTEIQNIVYSGTSNPALIELCQIHLKRLYQGLRASIGSRLIHYHVVQRYKARCMWYDRERLQKSIEDARGRNGRRSRIEDVLTRDLALYLFDQGISTIYRLRRGVEEYDLIGDRSGHAIFVEAKQYQDSNGTRRMLIDGVAQLHNYLTGLEADDSVVFEVYYIIFRVGGPLYDLPWEIPTNRRTFYPIIIDLAPSQESGRRAHQPNPIQLNEFFQLMGDDTPLT